jgi:hypothetical protein
MKAVDAITYNIIYSCVTKTTWGWLALARKKNALSIKFFLIFSFGIFVIFLGTCAISAISWLQIPRS